MSATITWLGHSTIRLTLPDERVIFIDPWLTENPASREPNHTEIRQEQREPVAGHEPAEADPSAARQEG